MSRFLSWAIDFLLSETSRRALVSTQPSIQWLPEIKSPGREADNSPPCSADVKNEWSYYNYTRPMCPHTVHIVAYCDGSVPLCIRPTPVFLHHTLPQNPLFQYGLLRMCVRLYVSFRMVGMPPC